MRVGRPRLVLGLLALPFVVLCALQAVGDSPTFDEPVYIQSGLMAIEHHDLRLNDEHPPLAKVLAALPVLLARPRLPPSAPAADEHGATAAFVRAQDRAGKLQRETELARIVPILEALACGLVLYRLGSRFHGSAAGLTAAALWWWNPFTIGLAHIDGIDLPATLTILVVAWALVTYLDAPGRRGAALLGLACGAAVLTRDTGVLVALGALGAVVANPPRRVRQAALVAVTAFVTVWVSYLILDPGHDLHLGLLPSVYLDGLHRIARLGRQPGPGFLLGHRWVGARWWYWPVAMVAKVPAPTLLSGVAGVVVVAGADGHRRRLWLWAVGLPAATLTLFTLAQARPVGARYLLPVVALLLVSAGAVLERGRRIAVAATSVVILTALASMAAGGVHSLAWTTWGYRPAYASLTDSNVDWGQDFGALGDWNRSHHARVAYFGPRGRTEAELAGAAPLLGVDRRAIRGWVAVSVTLVTGDLADRLGWLRSYCPVGSINGSVLLYLFRSPPVGRSPHDQPRGYCAAGSASS